MSGSYEESRDLLLLLVEKYKGHTEEFNEADTRLHFIDELFLTCLGWSKQDLRVESSHDGDYADYTFSAPRPLLIVEAKREGNHFELPAGTRGLEQSLRTLAREFPSIDAAIRQVAGYCQSRGVPIAAVANGHQLIAFVAVRTDATPPLHGKALVFASLEQMSTQFFDLWQALSKPGIEDQHLKTRLLGATGSSIPPKLSATLKNYPGTKHRNLFQADMQVVSDLVLEDVIRQPELETRFLRDCYCQSGALSRYAVISKSILQARYSTIQEPGRPGVTIIPAVNKEGISPELLADAMSRRPILIIGDVGIGKTTFIRHLMKVDAPELFENSLSLYLDLGSRATLTYDLRELVVSEVESQLRTEYDIDISERNFIRGVYHLDLERFGKGIYSDIREADPDLYRLKEIEFLEGKVQQREEHLKSSLQHLSRGRRKQVIIILDNADQRDDETQQQAFLISQELAEHWPATVFVTLRPETFHRSVKRGALSGYHPKAFTIHPPRIDQVITKRLQFACRLTSGEIPLSSLPTGTQVRLSNLQNVIEAFLNSLKRNRDLVSLIDNLVSGDVRLALNLVRAFFGSGHVDTAKIVDIWADGDPYVIPVHEFMRAIMYGDSEHYDPNGSPIANIFDVGSADPREHFIVPILVSTLASYSGPGATEGFVETSRIYDRLQGRGYTPDQIDAAIVRAHRHKLLETSARQLPRPGEQMPSALRVTSVGAYHVDRLMIQFAYFDAMVVDTPIFDSATREEIHDAWGIIERLERAEIFRAYLDRQWTDNLGGENEFNWPAASSILKADIEAVEGRARPRGGYQPG